MSFMIYVETDTNDVSLDIKGPQDGDHRIIITQDGKELSLHWRDARAIAKVIKGMTDAYLGSLSNIKQSD